MSAQPVTSATSGISTLDLAVGEERKRMGQFFTGTRVARLLAALGDASSARRIIDPMAGTGDMLIACLEVGSAPDRIAAIDIDTRALAVAGQRLAAAGVAPIAIGMSAFSPAVWKQAGDAWDLVITNPPYVRYQRNSSAHGTLPDADQIRRGLIHCIGDAHHLGSSEREAFLNTARAYSGLSDLAVPCWILCLAQVAPGGRVAMLVPNTWLSRKYAAPVADLLRRFFDLEFVVEDGDVSWFDDALVRTTLVVATRVIDKGTTLVAREHWDVRLLRAAGDAESMIARAVEGAESTDVVPERKFVRMLRDGCADGRPGVTARRTTDARIAVSIAASRTGSSSALRLPDAIAAVVEVPQLVTLGDLGWAVGQGLRSGANDFFYLTRSGDRVLSALLPGQPLDLPAEALRPAVFRQSEFGMSLVLEPAHATSCVLALAGFIHPSDASAGDPRSVMTGDLLRLVDVGSTMTYERQGVQRPLPSLSAVAPNARKRGPDGWPTFWYHLPPFTDRHRPAIAVPRVNGRSPRWRVNSGRELLVDANFTGLWPAAKGAVAVESIVTLIASSWAAAWFEAACTVMGGGALKVEATDLSRMPFPFVSQGARSELTAVGEHLLAGGSSVSDAARKAAIILGYGEHEEKLWEIVAEKQLMRSPR